MLAEEIVGLDEVPALAVAAAAAEGATRFVDVGELRVKETDRLATVVGQRCGPSAASPRSTATPSSSRAATLRGGTVDAHGDHRIAMATAVPAWRRPAIR